MIIDWRCQRYEVVEVKPYTRKSDGGAGAVARMRTHCCECGAPFEFLTAGSSLPKHTYLQRRCPTHAEAARLNPDIPATPTYLHPNARVPHYTDALFERDMRQPTPLGANSGKEWRNRGFDWKTATADQFEKAMRHIDKEIKRMNKWRDDVIAAYPGALEIEKPAHVETTKPVEAEIFAMRQANAWRKDCTYLRPETPEDLLDEDGYFCTPALLTSCAFAPDIDTLMHVLALRVTCPVEPIAFDKLIAWTNEGMARYRAEQAPHLPPLPPLTEDQIAFLALL